MELTGAEIAEMLDFDSSYFSSMKAGGTYEKITIG